jgi:hypothetical protein
MFKIVIGVDIAKKNLMWLALAMASTNTKHLLMMNKAMPVSLSG